MWQFDVNFQLFFDISSFKLLFHFHKYFPFPIYIYVLILGKVKHFVNQNLFYLSQNEQCTSQFICYAHLKLFFA